MRLPSGGVLMGFCKLRSSCPPHPAPAPAWTIHDPRYFFGHLAGSLCLGGLSRPGARIIRSWARTGGNKVPAPAGGARWMVVFFDWVRYSFKYLQFMSYSSTSSTFPTWNACCYHHKRAWRLQTSGIRDSPSLSKAQGSLGKMAFNWRVFHEPSGQRLFYYESNVTIYNTQLWTWGCRQKVSKVASWQFS